MATDLDLLADLDPLTLTKDGPEIRALVGYYRNTRAKEDSEGKKVRGKAAGPAGKISLDSLGLGKKDAEPVKVGTGVRRV